MRRRSCATRLDGAEHSATIKFVMAADRRCEPANVASNYVARIGRYPPALVLWRRLSVDESAHLRDHALARRPPVDLVALRPLVRHAPLAEPSPGRR
jgi:hypothetical protein